MTDATVALAPRLDAVVDAVPGVLDAYSARPVVARALHVFDEDEPLTHVQDTRRGRTISVCIGTAAEADSAAVASEVAEAVRAAGDAGMPTSILVRVGRLIAADPPPSTAADQCAPAEV